MNLFANVKIDAPSHARVRLPMHEYAPFHKGGGALPRNLWIVRRNIASSLLHSQNCDYRQPESSPLEVESAGPTSKRAPTVTKQFRYCFNNRSRIIYKSMCVCAKPLLQSRRHHNQYRKSRLHSLRAPKAHIYGVRFQIKDSWKISAQRLVTLRNIV